MGSNTLEACWHGVVRFGVRCFERRKRFLPGLTGTEQDYFVCTHRSKPEKVRQSGDLTIATFVAVSGTAAVVPNDFRIHLAQVKGIKQVFKEHELGFGADALVPVLFVPNERAGGGVSMNVVNVMDAHGTNCFTCVFDDKHQIFFSIGFLPPFALRKLGLRKYTRQVDSVVWVVDTILPGFGDICGVVPARAQASPREGEKDSGCVRHGAFLLLKEQLRALYKKSLAVGYTEPGVFYDLRRLFHTNSMAIYKHWCRVVCNDKFTADGAGVHIDI